MDEALGAKIKKLRLEHQLTLKELGEKAGLSVSYISMAERGRCSISLTSLQKIATAMGVNSRAFFDVPRPGHHEVTRSYEQNGFRLDGSYTIYRSLAGNIPKEERELIPVHVTLLPGQERKDVVVYSHEGEEFGYVLEGIMTFFVEDRVYELHPGDSLHIKSETPHNWANLTSQLVKLIYVNREENGLFD